MENKYKPQGTASVSGIILTLLIGIFTAILLPLVYIILGRLIPNIWFIAICALLLGMGLGFFIDLGIKIGKIRNVKVAAAIAIFCALLTFYMQWVFFDTIMYSQKGFTFKLNGDDIKILLRDVLFLFSHPNILFQEIINLNTIGTFRISGSGTVSGLLLWVLWAGEFLVIVGSTVLVVLNSQVVKPYSEINDAWMVNRKVINRINYVDDQEAFKNQIINKNLGVLSHNDTLQDHDHYAEVVVYESTGDPAKYISVINVQNSVDKKGKITAKRKNVLTHFQLLNANI